MALTPEEEDWRLQDLAIRYVDQARQSQNQAQLQQAREMALRMHGTNDAQDIIRRMDMLMYKATQRDFPQPRYAPGELEAKAKGAAPSAAPKPSAPASHSRPARPPISSCPPRSGRPTSRPTDRSRRIALPACIPVSTARSDRTLNPPSFPSSCRQGGRPRQPTRNSCGAAAPRSNTSSREPQSGGLLLPF